MDESSDVVHQLFGGISLAQITAGLETEIRNLLWKIKAPLGELAFLSLRRDPNPAEALVYALYDRRLDERLVEAFREYVLTSDGLRYMLTPEAKSEADKRKPRAISLDAQSSSFDACPPTRARMAQHTLMMDVDRNPESRWNVVTAIQTGTPWLANPSW